MVWIKAILRIIFLFFSMKAEKDKVRKKKKEKIMKKLKKGLKKHDEGAITSAFDDISAGL
jgi:uncharacterized membrane protein